MSLPNWDLDGKYTLIKKLGQGSYGCVCSARNLVTGEIVAIKELKGIFNDFLDARRMLREISVMRLLDHPCIIKIKEVILTKPDFNSLFIVMEHAETDLKKIIRSPTFLDHDQIKYLLYQALVGIQYMHSANILHRDLKPANILINSDCTLKICDFGLSRSLVDIEDLSAIPEEEEELEITTAKISMRKIPQERVEKKHRRRLSGHVVTRWYRAPELILLEKNYDKKIDVWSLGCVFAEMLSLIRDNSPYYAERGPLFPGKSCFPLSPGAANSGSNNGYPAGQHDQINIIMEILGTPNDQDLEMISDSKAIDYIKSFGKKEKKSLKDFFLGSTSEEIDLLEEMLIFNKEKRINIDELLLKPYFETVRTPELEYLARISADFDFDKEEDLSIDQMKSIFTRQVNSI
jgi:mitogen-activated protein kinase 1/3